MGLQIALGRCIASIEDTWQLTTTVLIRVANNLGLLTLLEYVGRTRELTLVLHFEFFKVLLIYGNVFLILLRHF